MICSSANFFIVFLIFLVWLTIGAIFLYFHPHKMPNHTFDTVKYPKYWGTKKGKRTTTLFILVLSLLGIFLCVWLITLICRPLMPKNLSDVRITLERTMCYGKCPSYKVTILGDGTVTYEGREFVETIGTQKAIISQEKIALLVDEFYSANYFSFKDEYRSPITDLPTTITSITVDGKTKQVVDYYGAPEKLRGLESTIDEMINSQQWIGNRF